MAFGQCVKKNFAAGLNGQIGEHDEIINGLYFAMPFHIPKRANIGQNARKLSTE